MTSDKVLPDDDAQSHQGRLAPDAAAQLREISHELRNPLNALSAIMGILSEERFGALGDPRYVEYARLAQDATDRMIRLCDRLLIVPDPAASARTIQVHDILTNLAATYAPMAEARGIVLSVDVADDLPDLTLDIEALSTVLNNLVTNAIKYTPSGGRVTLLARREPLENVALFVVSDTGIGLDAEELAHQMRPVDDQEILTDGQVTRGPHGDIGAGLGLIITRKAVAMLGGTLELRSRKGVGTCATVRLPLGVTASPQSGAA